jgi:hypothetical protein
VVTPHVVLPLFQDSQGSNKYESDVNLPRNLKSIYSSDANDLVSIWLLKTMDILRRFEAVIISTIYLLSVFHSINTN